MNIVTLDSAFILNRLNALPPHSRLRSGYCDILREIRKRELIAAAQDKALECRLAADLEFELTGGLL